MAEMTIRGAVQNTRNNVTDADGYALPPLAANLKEGQIAVNTCETDPCIFFKTSEGKIVKIVSEEKLTKALTDILGNSAADLDTLRELIAQFEGSANDILPMLTALTDRVTDAETSLTNKADKSALNTHTSSKSNPHSVTKTQVGLSNVDNTADSAKPVSTAQATAIADAKKAGTDAQTSLTSHVDNKANPHAVTKAQIGLGNVRNVEQLGKTETAQASSKLDNSSEFSNANNNPSTGSGTYFTLVDGISTNWQGQYGVGLTMARNPGGSTTSTVYTQLFSSTTDLGNLYLRKFKGNNSGLEYGDWCLMYHNGNSNLPTVNWVAKHITSNGNIVNNLNSYYLKTDSSWDAWARGLYWQNGKGVTIGGIDVGGATGDTVGQMTFTLDGVERIRINRNGNVGVNNPNPTEKFDVNGNGKFSGSIFACNNRVIIAASGDNPYIDLNDSTNVRKAIIRVYSSGNYQAEFLAGGINVLGVGNFTGNAYVGGNAGFGTNNPTDRVHAVGNIRATEKGIFGGNVEATGSGIFTGDVIAKKSGAVTFSTSDAAAGATRLNDLVDVKLPTTLSAKMVLAYDPAQVNSDGSKGGYTFMPSAGTGTGTVSSAEIASLPEHNHNDVGYVSASDERLKENIAPLTGALNILLHFKPKQYTWNAEGNRLGLNDPRAYGLIAQEAAELKDIVDIVRPMNTSEEYLGVDYVKIVPILVAGVQEQHKEIIALNQKLKTIQARANKAYGNETNNADKIAQLEAEIEELKMLIKK